MNVFAGQDGDADIEDRLGDTGWMRGRDKPRVILKHIHYHMEHRQPMGISWAMQGAQTGAL